MIGRVLNFGFLLPILVVVALVFACWGWAAQADALDLTVADIFFRAIGSVAMSNNYDDRAFFNSDWRVDVARVVGAAAFMLAASQAVARLLSYRAGRYAGRFRSGHLFVVGDHPVARGVVEAAAERRAAVTWIGHVDTELDGIKGALIIPQSFAADLAEQFGAARASRCVVAFHNEVEQIAAVRHLRAIAPKLPITMNFGDAWFAERMDELEQISGVRFVSQVQLAVRDLHWRLPPFEIARRLGHQRLHALIFGMGRGGEAVLNDLLLSSLVGFLDRPRVTIIDPRAGEIAESLRQRCPGLEASVEIAFVAQALGSDERVLPVAALAAAQADTPVTLAYVCVNQDARAMALAVSLQAIARREGWRVGPIFTRLVAGGALPDARDQTIARESAGLIAFGATEDFARSIGLFDADTDALPRLFHEAYRRTAPDHAVANQSWETLAEEWRESNRRLLIHLPAKLATANLDLMAWLDHQGTPAERNAALALPELAAHPALLERLAELEHRRWMMERHLSGWRHGPVRDEVRRLHPDLIPYDALTDDKKSYDRTMVAETWAALGAVRR